MCGSGGAHDDDEVAVAAAAPPAAAAAIENPGSGSDHGACRPSRQCTSEQQVDVWSQRERERKLIMRPQSISSSKSLLVDEDTQLCPQSL